MDRRRHRRRRRDRRALPARRRRGRAPPARRLPVRRRRHRAARAAAIAVQLESLAAAATEARPAYGAPRSLAELLRARAAFFGGACVVDPARPDVRVPDSRPDPAAYAVPLDFYAAYHVPFFATWAACERAAALAATGDRPAARALLEPLAARAPGRTWLERAAAAYR